MEFLIFGFGAFFFFLGLGAIAGLVWGLIKLIPFCVAEFRESYQANLKRLRR